MATSHSSSNSMNHRRDISSISTSTTRYSPRSTIINMDSKLSDSAFAPKSPPKKQHQNSSAFSFSNSLVWFLLIVLTVPLYACFHFNPYFIHLQYKLSNRRERSYPPRKIDRNTCSCGCWDGGSGGIYSKSDKYMHVYYNITEGALIFATLSFLLFSLTQMILFQIYRNIKEKTIDWWMALSLVVNFPALHYGIGLIMTYINEEDHRMIGSQMPFTVVEIIVTLLLLMLLDKKANYPMILWCLLIIDGTTLTKGSLDFLLNSRLSNLYALARTMALTLPDGVHICAALRRMSSIERRNGKKWMVCGGIVFFLVLFQFVSVGSD